MIEPLRISFDVACPAEHAFRVWTSGIGTWWPSDHTVTGGPERIVLTGGVGDRAAAVAEAFNRGLLTPER